MTIETVLPSFVFTDYSITFCTQKLRHYAIRRYYKKSGNCSITSNHEEFREIIDECIQFGGDYHKAISCSNGTFIINFELYKDQDCWQKENRTFAPEDGSCKRNS